MEVMKIKLLHLPFSLVVILTLWSLDGCRAAPVEENLSDVIKEYNDRHRDKEIGEAQNMTYCEDGMNIQHGIGERYFPGPCMECMCKDPPNPTCDTYKPGDVFYKNPCTECMCDIDEYGLKETCINFKKCPSITCRNGRDTYIPYGECCPRCPRD